VVAEAEASARVLLIFIQTPPCILKLGLQVRLLLRLLAELEEIQSSRIIKMLLLYVLLMEVVVARAQTLLVAQVAQAVQEALMLHLFLQQCIKAVLLPPPLGLHGLVIQVVAEAAEVMVLAVLPKKPHQGLG
jgi:hypothetical protein